MTEGCRAVGSEESYTKTCTFKIAAGSLAIFIVSAVALAIILALSQTSPETFATIGGYPLLGSVSGLAGASLLSFLISCALLKCRNNPSDEIEMEGSDSDSYSDYTDTESEEVSSTEEDNPRNLPPTPPIRIDQKKNTHLKKTGGQNDSGREQQSSLIRGKPPQVTLQELSLRHSPPAPSTAAPTNETQSQPQSAAPIVTPAPTSPAPSSAEPKTKPPQLKEMPQSPVSSHPEKFEKEEDTVTINEDAYEINSLKTRFKPDWVLEHCRPDVREKMLKYKESIQKEEVAFLDFTIGGAEVFYLIWTNTEGRLEERYYSDLEDRSKALNESWYRGYKFTSEWVQDHISDSQQKKVAKYSDMLGPLEVAFTSFEINKTLVRVLICKDAKGQLQITFVPRLHDFHALLYLNNTHYFSEAWINHRLKKEQKEQIAAFTQMLDLHEVFLHDFRIDGIDVYLLLQKHDDTQVHATYHITENSRDTIILYSLPKMYLHREDLHKKMEAIEKSYLLNTLLQVEGYHWLGEIEQVKYTGKNDEEFKTVYVLYRKGLPPLYSLDEKELEAKIPEGSVNLRLLAEEEKYPQDIGAALCSVALPEGVKPEDAAKNALEQEFFHINLSKEPFRGTPFDNFKALAVCGEDLSIRMQYFRDTQACNQGIDLLKGYKNGERRHEQAVAFATRASQAVSEQTGEQKPFLIEYSTRALVVASGKNPEYVPLDALASRDQYATIEDWLQIPELTATEEKLLAAKAERFRPSKSAYWPEDHVYVFQPERLTFRFFKTEEALKDAILKNAASADLDLLNNVLTNEGDYWFDRVKVPEFKGQILYVVYHKAGDAMATPFYTMDEAEFNKYLETNGLKHNRQEDMEGTGNYPEELEQQLAARLGKDIERSNALLVKKDYSPLLKHQAPEFLTKEEDVETKAVWFVRSCPTRCFKDQDTALKYWQDLLFTKEEEIELDKLAKRHFDSASGASKSYRPVLNTNPYEAVHFVQECAFALRIKDTEGYQFFKTQEAMNHAVRMHAIQQIDASFFETILKPEGSCWLDTVEMPELKNEILHVVYFQKGGQVKAKYFLDERDRAAYLEKKKLTHNRKEEMSCEGGYPQDIEEYLIEKLHFNLEDNHSLIIQKDYSPIRRNTFKAAYNHKVWFIRSCKERCFKDQASARLYWEQDPTFPTVELDKLKKTAVARLNSPTTDRLIDRQNCKAVYIQRDCAYILQFSTKKPQFFKTEEEMNHAVCMHTVQAVDSAFFDRVLEESGSYWRDTVNVVELNDQTLYVVYEKNAQPQYFFDEEACTAYIESHKHLKYDRRKEMDEVKGAYPAEAAAYLTDKFKKDIEESRTQFVKKSYSPLTRHNYSQQKTVVFIRSCPTLCFKDELSARLHWQKLSWKETPHEKEKLKEDAKLKFNIASKVIDEPGCKVVHFKDDEVYVLQTPRKHKFFKSELLLQRFLKQSTAQETREDLFLDQLLTDEKSCWETSITFPHTRHGKMTRYVVFYREGGEVKVKDFESPKGAKGSEAFIKQHGLTDQKEQLKDPSGYPAEFTRVLAEAAFTSGDLNEAKKALFNSEYAFLPLKNRSALKAYKNAEFVAIRHPTGFEELKCFKDKKEADAYIKSALSSCSNGSERHKRQIDFAKRVLKVVNDEQAIFKYAEPESDRVLVVRPPSEASKEYQIEYLSAEEAAMQTGLDAIEVWKGRSWTYDEDGAMKALTDSAFRTLRGKMSVMSSQPDPLQLGKKEYAVLLYKSEGFYCLFSYDEIGQLERSYHKTESGLQRAIERLKGCTERIYKPEEVPLY